MTQVCGTAVTFALALVMASSVSAQSLGDVARKEEARRKAVAGAGKVYTNEELRRDVAPARPAPSQATPSKDAAAQAPDKSGTDKSGAVKGAADKGSEKGAENPDPKKDQAYWRDRMAAARTGLDRARAFADALQSQINGLSAEFTARDDPAQRNIVADKRQKALDELARVKKEIADLEKAIGGIEDEARKAGVPPGWLR